MFRVTRQIDFCYGHRLLNYSGKCRFLHGHNGRAVITIEAEQLDERGMVLDFTDTVERLGPVDIIKGKTTPADAARLHGLTVADEAPPSGLRLSSDLPAESFVPKCAT